LGLASDDSAVWVRGTDHADRITVHQNSSGSLSIRINGSSQTIPSSESTAVVIDARGGADRVTCDSSVKVPIVILGASGNDTIRGGAGDDTLDGEAGNDRIYGAGGSDYLLGGGGADTIYAGRGDDLLVGGGGNDRLHGEWGDDLIEGGTGNDRIYGEWGADDLEGGSGNDTIDGGTERDYLQGDSGSDRLFGGSGPDVLYGVGGGDHLDGGWGDDYLDGGRGSDTLHGRGGNDVLFGGSGNDRIYGESGADLLAGGKDRDLYSAGSGRDRVFGQTRDRSARHSEAVTLVDLASVDASGSEPGSKVRLQGSVYFTDRLACDLEALRSIPIGRSMLAALDDGAEATHGVQIAVSYSGNAVRFDDMDASYVASDGARGVGCGSEIYADATRVTLGDGGESWMRRPPIVGLYHEMVHSADGQKGVTQPGMTDGPDAVRLLELQAVGLPFEGIAFLWDDSPTTVASPFNPPAFTENGFREFLGLPTRPRY
jgi:hypothetical protein